MDLTRTDEARPRSRRVIARVVLVLTALGLAQPIAGIPVLPGGTALAFGCPQPVALVNGSFESPDIPNGTYSVRAEATVPGWETTASDGMIEIWDAPFQSVPAADGDQFAELNANVVGALYQEIDTSTLQGQTVEYSFYHRGRSGTDTMRVSIGPAGGTANFTRDVSTSNTGWVRYTGSYVVPVGQTSTRFSYGAVRTAGGNNSVGNFLDGVTFGTPPCATDLSVTKTAAASSYLPGQPITYTITIRNTGAYPGQFDIVGARLTDTVPAAITGVTWSCSASAGSACGAASGSGNSINATYDILEGGTVTYTVSGTTPASGTPTTLTNTAAVALPSGVGEINSGNNTATVNTPKAIASLSLVKSNNAPTISLNQLVTYSFSVTNTGQVPLTNVTVSDPKVGMSAIDCGSGSPVVASLPIGANVVCTATRSVTLLDLLGGGISNTASVTGTPPPGITAPTATSTSTSPFTPAPAIALDKTSSASGRVALGDVITYRFAVRNTGNVPLDNVTVTDPHANLSSIDCGGGSAVIARMVPGGPVTCTATYTVSQADVDAGRIDNAATVTGTPTTGGAAVTASDTLGIDTVTPQPALSLDKTAVPPDPIVAGGFVNYTFVVDNTGNVTLTNVRVRDPLAGLSPVQCPSGTNAIASLAPADPPVTCTARYRVTQADIDRGSIPNTATADGTPPPGSPPVIQVLSSDNVPIEQSPAVDIVKSSDAAGRTLAAGDTIVYTFSVTNIGNVTLENLTVDDPRLGSALIDCDGDNVIATIAPGSAPVECTADYVVTQTDVNDGGIVNVATVTGTPPGSTTPVSDSSTVDTDLPSAPAVEIVKTAAAPTPLAVGSVIPYEFAVRNTGNVTLTDVTVTDTLPGLSAIDCGDDGDNVITSMAPGGPVVCQASYTLTQSDVDAGEVVNGASVSGTPVGGGTPVTDESSVTVPIERTPLIDLVKSSDVVAPEILVAGDTINYTFSVTNTGNVTLTDVEVTDTLPNLSAIDCGDGSAVIAELAPAGNAECTATYEVTQSDVNNGIVRNTATATGTPPAGLAPPSDTDQLDTPFEADPSIELVKSAEFTEPIEAGDEITYSFAVTNTGNVSLNDVTVVDPLPGLSSVDCGDGDNVIASMAPGGPVTCTATYQVSQDDVDAGSIENTATVAGTPFLGGDPVEASSSANVDIPSDPSLTVDKTASTEGPVVAGDSITFTILVTNTGNVTLNDVTVTDDKPGLTPVSCDGDSNVVAELEPGAAVTCTATYTVSQGDVDAGGVGNFASATGTPPGSDEPVTPVGDDVTVPADQTPALTLVKSSASAPVRAGDLVAYDLVVDNTGTVTLFDVTVADTSLPGISAVDCGGGSNVVAVLAPDDPPVTCTATYLVTQGEVDAGEIDNTATATGTTPPGAPPVAPVEGEATVPIAQVAELAIVKSSDATTTLEAGDVINFTLSVSNTGNVTLTDVTVTDPLVGLSAISCAGGTNVIPTLAPGAAPVECDATYTVTQADVDAEILTNTATVNGDAPDGVTPPEPASDTLDSPFTPDPSLTIDKTSDAAEPVGAGDTITFRIAVQNTGNVSLRNVTVTDTALPGLTVDCGGGSNVIPRLAPGGPLTCTATYEVSQADVDRGTLSNTASATGTPVNSETPLDPVVDELDILVEDPAPALTIVKSSSTAGPVAVGDEITYGFTVDNVGNVTLTDVTVTDELAGLSAIDCGSDSPTIASLAPDDPAVLCSATYVVTQADVDAGRVDNTASVDGVPPGETDPIDPVTDDHTVDTVDPLPALSITKTASTPGPVSVDDEIVYTITVENTGNVTLTNVVVTDALAGISAIDCDGDNVIATLAPADGPVDCTASYTVTQADVDAGGVFNSAAVTGLPPGGTDPIPPVTTEVEVPALQTSSLSIAKTASPTSASAAGDVITYTIEVENTGTVTLTDVTVTDALAGISPIDCGGDGDHVVPSLAPGATVTCTTTYQVLQSDVDRGGVTNIAPVDATPPPGAPELVPPSSTVDVPIAAGPLLTIVKTSNAVEPVALGDVVTYSFTVDNTGNVTLSDVTVTDPLPALGPIDCAGSPLIASLAPADPAVVCTASYTVTQADVDAGSVTNTASVTGTPPGSETPTDPVDSSLAIDAEQTSALELVKVASPDTAAAAGAEITYTLAVRNAGTVTLTDVTVTDPLPGLSEIDCGAGTNVVATLAPGAAVDCTATYTVSQDDADAGTVENTATATATPPAGAPPLAPVTADEDVPIEPAPALTIDKTASLPSPVQAGGQVVYTFAVTNTGTVTLRDVTVTDALAGLSAIDCGGASAIAVLAPGASATCTATYQLTQDDLDRGTVSNSATVTATPPGGGTVSDSDEVTTPLGGTGGLALLKTSGGVNDVDGNGVTAGDTITYFFVVSNIGATTIDAIAVDDPMLGGPVPCGSGPLAPGASRECEAVVHALTESELGTTLENTATATATAVGGVVLTATGQAVTVVPPACSVATTTSTTSTTTSTTSTTLEPGTSEPPPEIAPSSLPAEPTEPPETTSPEATTPTEAPVTTPATSGPAGFRGAVRPAQIDPCAPPPTTTTSTTVPRSGGGGTLPATGGDDTVAVAGAVLLLGLGSVFVVIGRRRRTASDGG